jgi:acyl carrier protein
MNDDIAGKVRAIIAETFNVASSDITDDTVADDVDGWDSLAHTVLMVRLQKKLRVAIPEHVAANVQTVGELIEALRRLSAAGAA